VKVIQRERLAVLSLFYLSSSFAEAIQAAFNCFRFESINSLPEWKSLVCLNWRKDEDKEASLLIAVEHDNVSVNWKTPSSINRKTGTEEEEEKTTTSERFFV
jgi:hypothetical protein